MSYREVLEMESSERLMTVGEVASWLGMSTPGIYKQCEKGSLPFHRIGEAIRFDRTEIEIYLASRKNLNISQSDKPKA
jgi:excisionase family DNA binding protein